MDLSSPTIWSGLVLLCFAGPKISNGCHNTFSKSLQQHRSVHSPIFLTQKSVFSEEKPVNGLLGIIMDRGGNMPVLDFDKISRAKPILTKLF